MDLVIELDNEGRIWVAGSDGTAPTEAWLHGATETPDALRTSGLCLLEEKYTPGAWGEALARHACGGSDATPAPHWRFLGEETRRLRSQEGGGATAGEARGETRRAPHTLYSPPPEVR